MKSEAKSIIEAGKAILGIEFGSTRIKAVLIDPEKNVIGFAADGNNGENYYVFSYNDTNGFECLMNETVNGNGYQSARGVYVDNTLYVVKGNIIEAYDMADYQKIDDLIL